MNLCANLDFRFCISLNHAKTIEVVAVVLAEFLAF